MVRNTITADDDLYDILNIYPNTAFNISVEGLLLNMYNLPGTDITKPYWRTSVMESTSIGGKNYFYVGDLNLAALNSVGVIYFNKRMAEDYQLGDLYDTVRSGNWTFDKLTEYCNGVTSDKNSDQVINEDDIFGLTTNGFAWQPFFAGTDSLIISKDENDIPVLNWDSERNIEVIRGIVEFVNDRESTILTNQYPKLGSIGWGQASINMFRENRALFWIELIYGVLQQRDMDADFGLLPMPKYDEKQEQYASYIHTINSSAVAVPITNSDADLTGRILEDRAYQSGLIVRPAYYDVTLKGKVSRDNDSGDMLDIIYYNVKLDMAVLLAERLPVDNNMRSFLVNNSTDFASTITSLKKRCRVILQKDVEAILELEH